MNEKTMEEKVAENNRRTKAGVKSLDLDERERVIKKAEKDLQRKAEEIETSALKKVEEEKEAATAELKKEREDNEERLAIQTRAVEKLRSGLRTVNVSLPVDNAILQHAVDATARPVYEAFMDVINDNGGLTPGNYLAVNMVADTLRVLYRKRLEID